MPEIKIFTIYVDQTNGNDTNNGTKSAPFKSLQKAIDVVPLHGRGDIHILGDYTLSSNVQIIEKKKITLFLHGTLTTTEYSPRDNYTGIYSIEIMSSEVHVIIDSDNNGKIIVPPKSSTNDVDPTRYTMFRGTKWSNFTDIKFDLKVKQNDYNPIVINSGFGLVSIGEWSDEPYLTVKLVGYYIGVGKNRNIIVDSNSTLVSFENAIGKFYYNYPGGLTDETNTPIQVSSCIEGNYRLL